MKRVVVTGASGFIGRQLVRLLVSQCAEVTCLVRESSRVRILEDLGCGLARADVSDAESVEHALHGRQFDFAFHLAGVTKSIRRDAMFKVNQHGTRNFLQALAGHPSPPTTVVVSSLAAAGPSRGRPRQETDPAEPVSSYGKSKLAAEMESQAFASVLPVSVVRPPIVFGPEDKDGLELFKPIRRLGFHAVPSRKEMKVSWIHVDDLCRAILTAAENGKRLGTDDRSQGVYFAASEEIVDYQELGQCIGNALGRRKTWSRSVPAAAIWSIAALNELIARVRHRPSIMNLDKAREAMAGSWTCSPAKLTQDTGFRCERSFSQTLTELVQWYRNANWL